MGFIILNYLNSMRNRGFNFSYHGKPFNFVHDNSGISFVPHLVLTWCILLDQARRCICLWPTTQDEADSKPRKMLQQPDQTWVSFRFENLGQELCWWELITTHQGVGKRLTKSKLSHSSWSKVVFESILLLVSECCW